MKLNEVPELIEGIINENTITEEMIKTEVKKFEGADLEILKNAFNALKDHWADFYNFMENVPAVKCDKDLAKLSLFLQALKWIQDEALEAIEVKDYERLAALKLLSEDIGYRVDQIVANFVILINKSQ